MTRRLDWVDGRVVEAYSVKQAIEVFYRDVKQNLGLGEYQGRRTLNLMGRYLATLGYVCWWLKRQCLRRLVDQLYQKFR